MFDSLTENLQNACKNAVKHLRGQSKLSAENMRPMLKEVRRALLQADVALPVIDYILKDIEEKALGDIVETHLSPDQALLQKVQNTLTTLMGEANVGLSLAAQAPAVCLLAGLQGSGKTTSTAKLARWLRESEKKKVMVVSVDIYRPAAIEQLKTLADEVSVLCHPSTTLQKPVDIAKSALDAAKREGCDVLLVDTAGRLHIDEAMMAEIKELHQSLNPIETLFVVDSMTGQDAANTARAFHEALPLTGVILTKIDGDARGGAALSIRHITGKPIKFLGVGEKTVALEPFHPDRIASRILGMGDMLTLIEDLERQVDKDKADKLAKKIAQKSKSKQKNLLDFEDFREQLLQMQGMDLGGMLAKIPGMNANMMQMAQQKGGLGQEDIQKMLAIINSMTKKERQFPNLIKGSRKRRIAQGSGRTPQEVNRVLSQFEKMQKMMKRFSGMGKINKLMQQFGKIPPGGGSFPGGF